MINTVFLKIPGTDEGTDEGTEAGNDLLILLKTSDISLCRAGLTIFLNKNFGYDV